MEPNSVLPYEPTKDDPLIDSITGYQKLLGKLIYLTHTRLDIAYYVHCLAQYMHSPLKSHLNCALNVLSDADWPKCLKTRKSVTEYRSLSSVACEIIWIQKLLLDLKTKVALPVDLFCDNKLGPYANMKTKWTSDPYLDVNRIFRRNYEASNVGDTQENQGHEEHKGNPNPEPSNCKIRRFETMKYSFNDDEEYITIKESEYLNHSKDSLDAYRELLRLIDEGWAVTTPKDE
ncbi:ribonuclease H-like domain-containing protein [Tanacetum coccineum]